MIIKSKIYSSLFLINLMGFLLIVILNIVTDIIFEGNWHPESWLYWFNHAGTFFIFFGFAYIGSRLIFNGMVLNPIERFKTKLTETGTDLLVWDEPGEINTLTRQINALTTRLNIIQQEKIDAMEKLYEREVLYFKVINQSPDGIVIANENGTIAEWNQGMAQITGIAREEALGRFLWDMQYEFSAPYMRKPEFYEKNKLILEQLFRTGNAPFINKVMETTLYHKSGVEKYVQSSVFIIQSRDGFIVGSIMRDMTDWKKMSDLLLQSHNYYLKLLDDFPNPIWRSDVYGKRDYFNKAWLKLTGRALEKEAGDGWNAWIHPDDRDRVLSALNKSIEEKGQFVIEYRLKDSSDRYRTIISYGNPISGLDNNYSGFVGSCFDITEDRLIQEKLQDAIGQKNTLIKEIHHRVKNNMQIISSLLSLESERIRDPQDLVIFNESQNRVRSMAIIHEKLYKSHDLNSIPFADYIQELAGYLLTNYRSTGGKIDLQYDLDDVNLTIRQAVPCGLLLNEVLTNAIKYAFPKGKSGDVSILFKETSIGNYRLSIDDNGIGMPENYDYKKSGSFGLSLVYDLAKQLNGKLTLESKPGDGTHIYLEFQGQ